MALLGRLSKFNKTELKTIRDAVIEATTRDELLTTIEEIIAQKEKLETEGPNACIPVSFFNIDPDYRQLLHDNGIENLAQLRSIKEEDLWSLKGMTHGGFEQISWAREFFNMEPLVQDTKPKTNTKGTKKNK